jgi:hypothetical protein
MYSANSPGPTVVRETAPDMHVFHSGCVVYTYYSDLLGVIEEHFKRALACTSSSNHPSHHNPRNHHQHHHNPNNNNNNNNSSSSNNHNTSNNHGNALYTSDQPLPVKGKRKHSLFFFVRFFGCRIRGLSVLMQ